MNSLQQQLRPLLSQFHNATGRGNLIFANSTLATIIQLMAAKIDSPCSCACASRSVDVRLEAVEQLVEEVVVEEIVAEEAAIEPVAEPVRRPRGRPRKVLT